MIQFNIVHWVYSIDDAESNISSAIGNTILSSSFAKRADVNNIPALMRRRFSQSMKQAFSAIDPHYFNEMPFVYATQNGEMQITVELIKQFHGTLSPAQFSLSVHNAGAGLISIVQKARQNYTVVDSLSGVIEHALLEAYSQLSQHPKVGIIYFENHLLSEFMSLTEHVNSNHALVLIVEKGSDYQLSYQSFLNDPNNHIKQENYIMPTHFVKNIAYFLSDQDSQTLLLKHGHLQWRWEKKCFIN